MSGFKENRTINKTCGTSIWKHSKRSHLSVKSGKHCSKYPITSFYRYTEAWWWSHLPRVTYSIMEKNWIPISKDNVLLPLTGHSFVLWNQLAWMQSIVLFKVDEFRARYCPGDISTDTFSRHWEAFIDLCLNRYQSGFGEDRLSTKKLAVFFTQEHGKLSVTLTLA